MKTLTSTDTLYIHGERVTVLTQICSVFLCYPIEKKQVITD